MEASCHGLIAGSSDITVTNYRLDDQNSIPARG